MTDSGGLEQYQISMADWARRLMLSKGSGLPKLEDFSHDELELFNEVFRRFTEIAEAIDNLDLCSKFISARAPRRKDMKIDAYLRYHIAFYLQECYILKERLKRYATKIMRMRKRRGDSVRRSEYKGLIDTIEATLSNIVAIRDAHVHDRPYDEESMKMLSTCSFLALHPPDNTDWASYARTEYAEVKRKWVKQLRNNRTELDKMLDVFFSFMQREVFDSDLLVLPNHSLQRTPLTGRR